MSEPVDQPSASVSPAVPAPERAAPPAGKAWRGAWKNPWLIVALVALALASWQWIETRARLARTQQELARRLADSDTVARESRALSKMTQEQLAALQGKLGEREA